MSLPKTESRPCAACGKTFVATRRTQKFCSRACCELWKKRRQRAARREEGRCPQCGGRLESLPFRRRGEGKITYCETCRRRFAARYRRLSRRTADQTKGGVGGG